MHLLRYIIFNAKCSYYIKQRSFMMHDDVTFGIIGAGNGGQSIAAHLGLHKKQVIIHDTDIEIIKKLQTNGGIQVNGTINGFGKITLATTSIKEVISKSDVIMVVTPATAHKDVAQACAQYLTDGQIIILTPGATGGVFEFHKILKENNVQSDVILSEIQSLFYACRLNNTGIVNIHAEKKEMPISTIPSNAAEYITSLLYDVFPQLTVTDNVLQTSLNNINPILHPTPTLLNMGLIDREDSFLFYLEGITPRIAEIIEQLDLERMEIGKVLKIEMKSTLNWLQIFYGVSANNIYETVQENKAYKKIKSPGTLDSRFLLEDIPMGLVPMIEIGELS